MKNILTLIFILGLGGLAVYFLWYEKDPEPTEVVSDIYLDQTIDLEEQTIETRTVPLPRGEAQVPATQKELDLNAVEFVVDDRGLILHKLYGQEVDLIITDNQAKDVTVYDGILTYSENTKPLEEGADQWEFKAVNLDAYIEAYLK